MFMEVHLVVQTLHEEQASFLHSNHFGDTNKTLYLTFLVLPNKTLEGYLHQNVFVR